MASKKRVLGFQSDIGSIFKSSALQEYTEDREAKTIRFGLRAYGYGDECFTYDQLKQLSELLGTEQIGLEGVFEHGYYDEINNFVFIKCSGVVFDVVVVEKVEDLFESKPRRKVKVEKGK